MSQDSGVTPPIKALYATSSLAVAVGNDNLLGVITIRENTGGDWTGGNTAAIGDSIDFFGVWGTGLDVLACGESGRIVRRAADGAWTKVEELGGITLRAIGGTAADDVFVVGDAGAIFRCTGREATGRRR